jgi:hypothetical protein
MNGAMRCGLYSFSHPASHSLFNISSKVFEINENATQIYFPKTV